MEIALLTGHRSRALPDGRDQRIYWRGPVGGALASRSGGGAKCDQTNGSHQLIGGLDQIADVQLNGVAPHPAD